VADRGGQPDGIADVGERTGQVTLEGGELAAGAERPGAFARRLGEPPGDQAEPLPALVELAGDLPVAGQPHGEVRAEPQPGGGIGRRRPGPRARLLRAERMAQGRANVLLLPAQRAQRPRLAGHRMTAGAPAAGRPAVNAPAVTEPHLDCSRHGHRPGGEPVEERLGAARVGEAVRAELTQRAEQPVPGRVRAVTQDHGLVDEAHKRGDDLLAGQLAVRAHVLGAADVERPGEHRQPLPQRPLGRAAQLVAPVDRGAQRLVPWAGAAAADCQRPDAGLQLARQFRQRQRAQPDGGELDRERYAVQPPAQPHDVRPVSRRNAEPGDDGRRALGEQLDRRTGRWQRLQREGVLAGHVERLPAGDDEGDARRAAQHGVGELAAGVDQVLARVEDEQQLPAAQVVKEMRPARLVARRDSDGRGDRAGQLVRVVDPAQVDQPDTVLVAVGRLRRGSQCEPGLAHAGRPGDRHEADGAEQRGEAGELILTADEAGGLRGQQAKPSRAGDLASGDDVGHGYLTVDGDVATITLGRR
jgi:hypothetical protein